MGESRQRVEVLGIEVDNVSLEEACFRVEQFINAARFALVVTANPEIIMLARRDPEFMDIIRQADLVTADGTGVVWAGKWLGTPFRERVAGVDLVEALLARAREKGWLIFLLGAKPGVAEKAARRLQEMFPGIAIAGTHHGYFREDEEPLALIKAAKPHLLLVGMGMGRQEKWVWRNRRHLAGTVCIGVGGTLDVLAGEVKRAPRLWRRLGLEWLYRLLQEPWRIRRLLVLPAYVGKVISTGWKRKRGKQ